MAPAVRPGEREVAERTLPAMLGKLGSFLLRFGENYPSGATYSTLTPCYSSLPVERTQLVFYPTYSCRNSSAFFSWVRFVKKYFYRELPSQPHSVVFLESPCCTYLHTPILSQSQKYGYRTLEGLEGLEAFLLHSYPVAVTALRATAATFCRFRNVWQPSAALQVAPSSTSGLRGGNREDRLRFLI
jgi:hypothetical protein